VTVLAISVELFLEGTLYSETRLGQVCHNHNYNYLLHNKTLSQKRTSSYFKECEFRLPYSQESQMDPKLSNINLVYAFTV